MLRSRPAQGGVRLRPARPTGAARDGAPAAPTPLPARAMLRNMGWLTAAQLIGGGGQFALAVLLARHLGVDAYGTWAFALAFVSVFYVVADFGFSTIAVPDLVRAPGDTRRYVGNVILIKTALAAVIFAVMAASAPLLRPDLTVWLLVLLLGGHMLSSSMTLFLLVVFRARQQMHVEAAVRAVQTALLLGIAALFVTRGAGVLPFGVAALSASAATLGVTAAVLTLAHGRPSFALDLAFCRSALRAAWPLALAMVCTSVYYYLDSVLIGVFRSDREVGLYAAAYVPVLAVSMIVTAVRVAFLPAQSATLGRDGHARVLHQYGMLTAVIALPTLAGGVIVARPLLELLYGADYTAASTALRLLFVTGGVMFLSSYFGSELIVSARQRTYLVGTGLGAAINVVLNIALIPTLGIEGAAIATLAAESGVCLFLLLQTHIDVRGVLAAAALPAAAMSAVLLPAAQLTPLPIAVALAAVTYGVALLATSREARDAIVSLRRAG